MYSIHLSFLVCAFRKPSGNIQHIQSSTNDFKLTFIQVAVPSVIVKVNKCWFFLISTCRHHHHHHHPPPFEPIRTTIQDALAMTVTGEQG